MKKWLSMILAASLSLSATSLVFAEPAEEADDADAEVVSVDIDKVIAEEAEESAE